MRKKIAISEVKGEAVTMGDIFNTIDEEATRRTKAEMQAEMDVMRAERDAKIAENDAVKAENERLKAELEELRAKSKN